MLLPVVPNNGGTRQSATTVHSIPPQPSASFPIRLGAHFSLVEFDFSTIQSYCVAIGLNIARGRMGSVPATDAQAWAAIISGSDAVDPQSPGVLHRYNKFRLAVGINESIPIRQPLTATPFQVDEFERHTLGHLHPLTRLLVRAHVLFTLKMCGFAIVTDNELPSAAIGQIIPELLPSTQVLTQLHTQPNTEDWQIALTARELRVRLLEERVLHTDHSSVATGFFTDSRDHRGDKGRVASVTAVGIQLGLSIVEAMRRMVEAPDLSYIYRPLAGFLRGTLNITETVPGATAKALTIAGTSDLLMRSEALRTPLTSVPASVDSEQLVKTWVAWREWASELKLLGFEELSVSDVVDHSSTKVLRSTSGRRRVVLLNWNYPVEDSVYASVSMYSPSKELTTGVLGAFESNAVKDIRALEKLHNDHMANVLLSEQMRIASGQEEIGITLHSQLPYDIVFGLLRASLMLTWSYEAEDFFYETPMIDESTVNQSMEKAFLGDAVYLDTAVSATAPPDARKVSRATPDPILAFLLQAVDRKGPKVIASKRDVVHAGNVKFQDGLTGKEETFTFSHKLCTTSNLADWSKVRDRPLALPDIGVLPVRHSQRLQFQLVHDSASINFALDRTLLELFGDYGQANTLVRFDPLQARLQQDHVLRSFGWNLCMGGFMPSESLVSIRRASFKEFLSKLIYEYDASQRYRTLRRAHDLLMTYGNFDRTGGTTMVAFSVALMIDLIRCRLRSMRCLESPDFLLPYRTIPGLIRDCVISFAEQRPNLLAEAGVVPLQGE